MNSYFHETRLAAGIRFVFRTLLNVYVGFFDLFEKVRTALTDDQHWITAFFINLVLYAVVGVITMMLFSYALIKIFG